MSSLSQIRSYPSTKYRPQLTARGAKINRREEGRYRHGHESKSNRHIPYILLPRRDSRSRLYRRSHFAVDESGSGNGGISDRELKAAGTCQLQD
jgi:hypothetical protein